MQPSHTAEKPQRINDTGVAKRLAKPNSKRPRGATVARLTPDQKVACSNHVGVMLVFIGTYSTQVRLALSPPIIQLELPPKNRDLSITPGRLVEAPNPKQYRPGRSPTAGLFTALGGGSPCLKLRRMKRLKPARVTGWFLAFTRLCFLKRNTVRGPSKGMPMDCPASTVC